MHTFESDVIYLLSVRPPEARPVRTQGWSPSPSSNKSGDTSSSSSITVAVPRERERRVPRRRTTVVNSTKQTQRESSALGVDTNVLLQYIKEVSAKVDEDALVKTQKIERARARRREREREQAVTHPSTSVTEERSPGGWGRSFRENDRTSCGKEKEPVRGDWSVDNSPGQTSSADVSMDVDGSVYDAPPADKCGVASALPSPADRREQNGSLPQPSADSNRSALGSAVRSTNGRHDNLDGRSKASSPLAQPPIFPSSHTAAFDGDRRDASKTSIQADVSSQGESLKGSDALTTSPILSTHQAIAKPRRPPVLGMRRYTSSQTPSTSQTAASTNIALPTKQKQFRPPLPKVKANSSRGSCTTSGSTSVAGNSAFRNVASTEALREETNQEHPSSPTAGDESFRSVDFDMGVDDVELEKVCSMYD